MGDPPTTEPSEIRLCLRCDWEGRTKDRTCPNCGTRPLYRVELPGPTVEPSPGPGQPPKRQGDPPSAGIATPSTSPPLLTTGASPPEDIEPTSRSGRSTVVVSILGVLALIAVLGPCLGGSGERPTVAAPSSALATPTNAPPSQVSSPSPERGSLDSPRPLPIGRERLTVRGTALSFSVPTKGWGRFGDLFIAKSSRGPQGAEAILLWTRVDKANGAEACGQWWGSPVGSARDWATRASKARGTELVLGPTSVTVGGYPAQHVVVTVSNQAHACDPGFFHTWQSPIEGPFWSGIEAGDTVRIWLVHVGGTVLYVEADTRADAGARLEQEIEGIVDSISFG